MQNKTTIKKIIRLVLLAVFIFICGCIALIYFSPYKVYSAHQPKMVRSSLVINCPVDSVFKFVGDNSYTKDWIIYVDHIKILSHKSDTKGEIRSYYFNADETGQQFDAILLDVNPNRKRKLLLYNFNDFAFDPGHVVHEQLYKKLPGNKCELLFNVYYEKPEVGVLDDFKASIAAYRVKKALEENMNNLKAVIEDRPLKKI